MSAHTPGPWRFDPKRYVETGLVHGDAEGRGGYHVVEAAGGYAPNGFHMAACITEPDARLIAAAPDLLAACEATLGVLDQESFEPEDLGEVSHHLRAAIAKARGR